jgi:hypothetical protein
MLYIGTNLPFHRELRCEGIELIHLAEDMASERLFMNTVRNLWVP